jgi:hypothetical protein
MKALMMRPSRPTIARIQQIACTSTPASSALAGHSGDQVHPAVVMEVGDCTCTAQLAVCGRSAACTVIRAARSTPARRSS